MTILVDRDVDLSRLAPTFHVLENAKLYTAGSSVTEVSGQSIHNFSDRAVQYTVSTEDGSDSKNYWLQVVKASGQEKFLYVNSLADTEAKLEGIQSTREVILDSYHHDIHDILLVNMGTEAITEMSVELVSDVVELDDYWTLKGNFALSGFDGTEVKNPNGELTNMAKLRLRRKKGVAEGTDVSSTLTVKSGTGDLLVFNLTGMIGDPHITTTKIPEAVKYVPYGIMIQNSNKYSWNTVNYFVCDGKLPEGIILKPNGELYGVPKETGTFEFRVEMRNSGFGTDFKDFLIEVKENTDANVDNATDLGYDVITRIQNLYAGEKYQDQLFVSEGAYEELVDVYLDGEKLERNIDYIAESGSTRITIMAETLDEGLDEGTHTLGVEFRTTEDDSLKKAAQNFDVVKRTSGDGGTDEPSPDIPIVTPETSVTPTPTQQPNPTLQPSATPNLTPQPTPTTMPFTPSIPWQPSISVPTITEVPQPTVILTPTPTLTPIPTVSPIPTSTPVPTNTPKPTSTPTPEPARQPEAGEPFVKNDIEIIGWNAIKEQLKGASDGEVVIVDMNDSTVVPGEVMEAITGRNVILQLEMGKDIVWAINGNSIISDKIGDIDFEVRTGENANEIPVEIVDDITGERYTVNLTLAHDGKFGFTAVLCIDLGKKNAGLYANLFYYDEPAEEMEFICTEKVDKAGIAKLSFTHASDYIIVLDEKAMGEVRKEDDKEDKEKSDGKEENNTKDNDKKDNGNSTNVTDKDLPKTALKDSVWFLFAGMLLILLGGDILLVTYDKRQSRNR